MEMLPLVEGGLEPLMKALTAAFRRCSSSISAFRLRLMVKKTAPRRPPRTTTPTTVPAAIPATLVFFLESVGASVGVASADWLAGLEGAAADEDFSELDDVVEVEDDEEEEVDDEGGS